jgi:hypothetical protein
VPENNAGVRRICVHSGSQFRFSLPGGTPDEQVRTFIQVYALGLVDGQSARSTTVEDHIWRTTSEGGSISQHGDLAKPLAS